MVFYEKTFFQVSNFFTLQEVQNIRLFLNVAVNSKGALTMVLREKIYQAAYINNQNIGLKNNTAQLNFMLWREELHLNLSKIPRYTWMMVPIFGEYHMPCRESVYIRGPLRDHSGLQNIFVQNYF